MRRSTVVRVGIASIAVLDLVAVVEAVRIGQPLLAVFTSVAGLVAVALTAVTRRPCVALRSDLADWTARTAAATGEEETRVVDRAIARHRAALDGERAPDG